MSNINQIREALKDASPEEIRDYMINNLGMSETDILSCLRDADVVERTSSKRRSSSKKRSKSKTPPKTPVKTKTDLERMKVVDLKLLAKRLGIKNFSIMLKADLIKNILSKLKKQ